ncbi:shikimate dehydrogenase [Aliiglaciecola litoralis]|uniref:Shikimate dehydrogenase (NADP(+)) n=1 Tax=Aliiglaciecola litoralis TaxID=582857 RepID=A0ABP3X7T1_9ALTE
MTSSSAVDRYAVFGNPIAQSKSPTIHQLFALQTEQDLTYDKILGQVGGFSASLAGFFADPYAKGCNVTMPFKEDAANWVTELSPAAQAAGAVNTISRLDNGGFRGDNTDGQGLVVDLENQQFLFADSNVLLIGAGGAAKGVVLPLLQKGLASLDIVNRTQVKAISLCDRFNDERLSGKSFEQVNREAKHYDLIVNCTSTSLQNELPPLSEEVISRAEHIYDMVYQSADTIFIAKAKQLDVKKTSDGLGMLVGQAAYSFFLWRGVMPKIQPVLDKLRVQL